MAGNIALGKMEVQQEHSGDESDDDVDDVVEQSPCGRWEKRRQEVSLLSSACLVVHTFLRERNQGK